MTNEDYKLLDYLFEGATAHYTERRNYIDAGGEPTKTILLDKAFSRFSVFYRSWNIEDKFNGEVKIFKLDLTEENKKRIHEYLASI